MITPEQWLLEGEVGVSSKTIWAVMMGVVKARRQCDNWHYDVPHDPDDFGRCYTLLILFPKWRKRLAEVCAIFPKWTPFVREWPTLEKMYVQWQVNREDYYKRLAEYHRKRPHRRKPRFEDGMCEFMQRLVAEGMELDGWVQTGPGSWRRGEAAVIKLGGE